MANCIQCGRKLPPLSFGKKICSWCVQHDAAQRGEASDDTLQRVETPPWMRRQDTSAIVTRTLFGINVAVFAAMLLAGVAMLSDPDGQDLIRWGANYGPFTTAGQYWRLLTGVFVHGGLLHIAFNMWCLWDLGALAESLYGHVTFAVVYLLAGIGASLASVIWNPGVLSVGASGAIFGIAGALIASFYLGEFSLPRAAVAATLRSVVVFVGYNLVFGAMISRVDNAAHVGGLLTGLFLGALIAKGAPDGDSPRRWVVIALAIALIVGGTAWYLYSRDYIRHMQRGAGFLTVGKTDQAIAEFQTVARHRPEYSPAYFALGRAYALKDEYAQAEQAFQRAIALSPRAENYYYNLGFVYLSENKTTQARETFLQILGINQQSLRAHYGLGMTDMAEQKYPDALKEFQAAAALDPSLQGVYFQQGQAYAKLARWDDAIASFKKEVDTSGEDEETLAALAAAYDAKGMKAEAAAARKKAAELSAH